jgi:hypothetical protein
MRTAGGAREQERVGAGVDAARAGGVTLTRKRYAGSKRQLGIVQGGTQCAGARGLDLGRRAVRHQALERRIDARGGVAARSVVSAEMRGWS